MAMHKRLLPVLDPCGEDFARMTGASSRFCTRCSTAVHDLSQMTEREARLLLGRHAGGTLCVRYRAHRDGRVHFAPAPSARRVSTVAVLGALSTGCAGHGADELIDPVVDGVCSEDQALAGLCQGWGYEEVEATPEPPTLDELLDGEEELDVEDVDEPFAFAEEPVTDEPFDPNAPDEGCEPADRGDGYLMGVMVVPAREARAERTKAYLRERTDRWRAWLAERKEERDQRRLLRKAQRLARKGS